MSGSCAVRGRRFAQPCRENWPISPGPSCSSEPRSSLPGPAALEPPVYDRGRAAISDRGLRHPGSTGATDVRPYKNSSASKRPSTSAGSPASGHRPTRPPRVSLVSGDATAHEDSVLSVDVDDVDAAYALAQATGLLP